jgi:acyl carrier protein
VLQTDFKVSPDKISMSAHLRHDLAFDSLTLTDLAFIIRTDFGVDAPAEEFRAVDTVGALVNLIAKYG